MAMKFSAPRLKKSIFPYVSFIAETKLRDVFIRRQSQSVSILEDALKKNVVPMKNMGGLLLWQKTSRLILGGCASLRAASFFRERGLIADNSNFTNPLVRCARLYATSTNGTRGLGGPATPHESSYMELSGLMGTKFYKTFEDFIVDGKEILADYDFTHMPYDISDLLKNLIRDMVNQIKLIHDYGFHIHNINVKKFDVYMENNEFVLKIKGDVSDLKKIVQGSVENDLIDLGGLLQDIITAIRQQLARNKIACNPNFGYDLEDFAILLAAKKSLDNFTGHPFFYDIGCKIGFLIWAVEHFRNLECNEIEMEMTHFRRMRQQKATFWEPCQFAHVSSYSVYDMNSQGFIKCFKNVSFLGTRDALLNAGFKFDANHDTITVEKYFRARCPEFFCVAVYALHNHNTNCYKNSWPKNLPKPF